MKRTTISLFVSVSVSVTVALGCGGDPQGQGGGGNATTSTTSTTTSGGTGACLPGTPRDCYTGPAATEGVGVCKAGKETCLPDGSGYGACEGEVAPGAEVCGDGVDDDCNGVDEPCAGPTHVWSHRYGDDSVQIVEALAVDGKGHAVIGGMFTGTLDFGTSTQAVGTPGDVAAFVVKLDPQGTALLSESFGAAPAPAFSYTQVTSAGTSAANDIVVAGSLLGAIDLGGVHLTNDGFEDAFVLMLDASGAPLWGRAFSAPGTTGAATVTSLAVDPTGDVVVVGRVIGTVDFGGVSLTSNGTPSDVFLAKLSGSSGAVKWAERFGSAAAEDSSLVAVAPDGAVVVATSSIQPVDFGQGPLPSKGGFDTYVAAFSGTDGGIVWAKSYGGPGFDTPSSLSIRPDGGILLAGTFDQTADFGGGHTLTSAGASDIFVMRAGADGSAEEVIALGGSGHEGGALAREDAAGDLHVVGSFDAEFSIGAVKVAAPGGQASMFLTKILAGGGAAWAASYGTTGRTNAWALAADGAGALILAGVTDGEVNFGGGPLAPGGAKDAFVVKMAP